VPSPLIPVDEAIAAIEDRAGLLVGVETVSLINAQGRYLAEDVVAAINVPPHDNSAMDGYAVRASDVQVGQKMPVSDRIPAGHPGKPLTPGTAARIFTGAPIPQNADAVIIQEDAVALGDEVEFNVLPEARAHIRDAGQDIRKGSVVLAKGRRIRPQDIGLLASVGCAEVSVFERLKVGVMSTGDELVDPPAPVQPGQIYNSNHYVLQTLLHQLGMQPVDLGRVADTPEATDAALRQGAADAHCILSSGGVSVGDEDHVKAAIEKLGALELWRLAIKPGKPLAFGRVLETPLFGLPGNPVSGFVTFLLIARRYLLKCQGGNELDLNIIHARAGFAIEGGSRREYIRVQLENSNDHTVAHDFANQGSGVMSSLSWAHGLAEVEIGRTIQPGDPVKVYLLP
jgi:molybdopterin molybdotransferase